MRAPRTTLPAAPVIVVVPGSVTETVLVGGAAAYVVVLPSYGSCASSTAGFSMPFAAAFRKWSNHLYASVAYTARSGAPAGELPGGWPRSPR